MKKKLLCLILAVVLLRSCFIIPISAFDDITVILNGQRLYFDQQPILYRDRTLVPMRKIFEALGCEISWIEENQTVQAYKNGEFILSLKIGEKLVCIGNISNEIDVAPMLVNDRTLVPLRVVSEYIGAYVKWDDSSNTVNIYYNPPYSDTPMWLAYYKCHPNVLNFGAYIKANPYSTNENSYYYEYYGQGSMKTTVDEYIAAMKMEGYILVNDYQENGANRYYLYKQSDDCNIRVIDDFLLEHIEIHIDTNANLGKTNYTNIDIYEAYLNILLDARERYNDFSKGVYPTGIGYVNFIDFDNDGTKEMIYCVGYNSYNYEYNYEYYIYGWNGSTAILLDDGDMDAHSGQLDWEIGLISNPSKTRLIKYTYYGLYASSVSMTIGELESGEWVEYDDLYASEYYEDESYEGYYEYYINDEQVSETEYNQRFYSLSRHGEYIKINDSDFSESYFLDAIEKLKNKNIQ